MSRIVAKLYQVKLRPGIQAPGMQMTVHKKELAILLRPIMKVAVQM
jgi:hypothetical protein